MGSRAALDLTFLGSGNAFGDARCYSGFLLNGTTLFDCPPTSVYSLKRAACDLDRIDTILISHFHADHYFGLPFLLLDYRFPGAAGGQSRGRERDLTIVGPPGIGDVVEKVNDLAFPRLLNPCPNYRRKYVEITPGQELQIGSLRLGAARMNHANDSLALALGFRVQVGGRTLAYTGDTAWCDSLSELGRGAEVYVTDANYPSGRGLAEHLSLDEVRDLRDALSPKTHLILTHLGHSEAPTDMPRTFTASDLARFTFP